MKNKPFEIRQVCGVRTLELTLYGEIEGDYYDWWSGEKVESTTSARYVQNAVAAADDFDRVNVYINSIGGSVSEGVAIHNILKRCGKPVNVYIDAFAYSVASVIAMAGDKVFMPSNATMMIHNAMMGCFGNSSELRKAADDLDVINEASCNSYLTKSSKITKEQLQAMLDAETFLTADTAFAYGLCDEIINPVNLADSAEIAEQALRCKNPAAKQAAERIRQAAKQPTPQQPDPQQQEPDVFDWLRDAVDHHHYF